MVASIGGWQKLRRAESKLRMGGRGVKNLRVGGPVNEAGGADGPIQALDQRRERRDEERDAQRCENCDI